MENKKYIVHSDVDENNIYSEFEEYEEAVEYAEENREDQTWVDLVIYDDETEEIIEVERVWEYLE